MSARNMPGSDPRKPDMETAIIGAGFSGLGMAIRLKKAGRTDFTIFEQADEIGGTWRDNTYPGCACDVMTPLYSFSFEPNPGWSRLYGGQDEIWAYLRGCAEKHGLYSKIRFGTEVQSLAFDDAAGLWNLYLAGGERVTARNVVAGLGPLNKPLYPDIPGRDSFEGKAFHSMYWDHDYDLTGKRVAVIGTGASAIQFVPQIAPKVERLYVFQRTPPWIAPKFDPLMPGFLKWLFRVLPFTQGLLRAGVYWRNEGLFRVFAGNEALRERAERYALAHMEKSIADPALRKALTPDYAMGCKRILISNDYYPALARENVELVTDPIAEIRPRSIVTKDGVERPVDTLLYGTGFRATQFLSPMTVTGRGGRSLNGEWANDDVEAYLGTMVSGYPNLFFLGGPNTGIGHTSLVYMVESQIAYILDYLRKRDARGLAYMDVKPEVQRRFNEDLQARMEKTVWLSGCKSWYQNASGKVTTLWPDFTYKFRRLTARVKLDDFEQVTLPAPDPAPLSAAAQ